MSYNKPLVNATKTDAIIELTKINAGNGSYIIYKGDPEYNSIWIEFQPEGSEYSTPIVCIENPPNPEIENPAAKLRHIAVYLYEDPFRDECTTKRIVETEKIKEALGVNNKNKKIQTYFPPTPLGIGKAIMEGFSAQEAKQGYTIMGRYDYNTGVEAIERIDIAYADQRNPPDDESCAQHAKETGYAKIIPVEQLPANFEPKIFGFIDTPKNRERIEKIAELINKK